MNLDLKIPETDETSREANERREWLRDVLSSIGDAVITTDVDGRVTFLNPVAQALTGWSQVEAAGIDLAGVFRIVNEESRETVESPARRVLLDGARVTLTDHTLLIAKDGVEHAIDESAAPIRNVHGTTAGVVLVFRDASQRRREERMAHDALEYADNIIASLREPFLVLDSELKVRTANTAFYQTFLVSRGETEGRFLYDLGDGQWNVPRLLSMLEEPVSGEKPVKNFRVEQVFPAIGHRCMLLNSHRFPTRPGHPEFILLAIRDVTERKRTADALKDSELRYRRLFHAARDGILILDADTGEIIDANPFIIGLLGYELVELVGKQLWEIGLFRDKKENQAAYRVLRETGFIRYQHLPLRTKNGDEVAVEFVSNLYTAGQRRVAQCNIRNITERCRLERQAKAQAESLADLHRRKDEFLAILSHELRNPLVPILSALDMLRLQGNEDVIQKQARGIIERQVAQLTCLVNDLLEVARITTGRVRLERERLDMRTVVEHAVETARSLIDRRRHVLTITLPPVPIWLHGDPGRLEQVVVNLLNNAAKYTDEGGRIDIGAHPEGAEMVLSVRDTGIGIDLALFPNIFDLFAQADRSLDRAQGGLGIGLCLVQRLVELHEGMVTAHSDGLGLGSEFTVRLPLLLAQPAHTSATPTPATKPRERLAPAGRVLVVDDNVDTADIMSNLLRLMGHDVRTVYTGPDALDAAREHLPDVVLLDIGLPGLNGYEVARHLRQLSKIEGVRLVALTGHGDDSDVRLAHEAGFDTHLLKPVDFPQVRDLVTNLLKPSRAVDGG